MQLQPQPPALATEPQSEAHRLTLFQSLTPAQQRVLLLSVPGENRSVTASRCGVSEETLDAWLHPSHIRHSPAFRTLYLSRSDPTQAIAFLERALEHHAPRNLERTAAVAALLDQGPEKLGARVLAVAAGEARALWQAPLERHDKRRSADQGDALVELIAALAGKRREVQGVVVDVAERRQDA